MSAGRPVRPKLHDLDKASLDEAVEDGPDRPSPDVGLHRASVLEIRKGIGVRADTNVDVDGLLGLDLPAAVERPRKHPADTT